MTFHHAWSSPSRRATETVNAIMREMPTVHCELQRDLLERHGGIGQGRLPVSALWREPDMDAPVEGAERLQPFASRIGAFLLETQGYEGDCGLVVTHGGVIAVMQWLVNSGDLAKWVRGMPDPGGMAFVDLPTPLVLPGWLDPPHRAERSAPAVLHSRVTT